MFYQKMNHRIFSLHPTPAFLRHLRVALDQAKLKDQIGKQSSLADEAASYQYFEEMPSWAPWEWHGRSPRFWSNVRTIVLPNSIKDQWPFQDISGT